MMELRVLRYFLAVAREGNFTRASQMLHVSQPALSKQIMELEEELGQPLFLRGSRKVTLTPYGKILEQRAQEILQIVQKTEEEFSGPKESLTGDLRIGCGEGRTVEPVTRVMARIHRVHPDVMLHLFTGITTEVVDKLQSGALDFGAVSASIGSEEYNFLQLPMEDNWGIVMRRDDPMAKQSSMTPEQLLGMPLIVSRHALVRNELSGWLGRSMQELHITATCDMYRNASLLVREGVGYLLTYDLPVEDESLCFKPLSPRFSSRTKLVWKKNFPLSPAAQAFLEMMQQELSETE